MCSTVAQYEAFVLATADPFLDVLIGTMEEPAGTSNAMRAGQLTLAWWDEHDTGPSLSLIHISEPTRPY